MQLEKNKRSKTCPRCGDGFGCYTEDCWCSELPQIMPMSETEDCLCSGCLKKIISKKIEEAGFTG